MKKTVILFIAIMSASLLLSCKNEKVLYEAGEYEGVGQGHHGPIKVIVTTNEYCIKDIKIIEEYEMPELTKIVYDKIPKKVIKTNCADVDVVAGASYTSHGLIEAIKDGLKKACKAVS
jgi:uncharacterized protein with FMN-binding domain